MTDESQGGGNLEYKSEDFTTVGGAFGLEYNLPFSGIGNLPPGVDGHLQLGMWGEYVPGNDIQVRTSTFNIDYIGRTQGTWLGTVRGGIGLRF
ncbi:MAG: hypothetical protein D6690_16640 [Nitrospirae bacterium]|nr:MAG: hypothetical protein D6690_16640 [Nitrospirota bacterium]